MDPNSPQNPQPIQLPVQNIVYVPNEPPGQNQIPPQNNTPAQPPPEKTPKHHPIRKILFFILAIALIAGSIGTGYYFFIMQKLSSPNTNNPSSPSMLSNPIIQKLAEKIPFPKITLIPITPLPSNPPIVPSQNLNNNSTQQPSGKQNPTTNSLPSSWETYKNTADNFSITYPAGLQIKENDHGLEVIDVSFIDPSGAGSANSPEYQFLLYPKSIGNLIGQNFDTLYALPAPSTNLMTSGSGSPQQFTKIKNRTLNSLRAFDYKTTSNPPDPTEEAEVGTYIEVGDNILTISTGESNRAVLDHMLTTFKYPLQ